MKHTLKALIALLMLAAVLLTGCSGQSDTMKKIEDQKKSLEERFKTVIAEYDGGTITMMDVLPSFYSMYSYYYQLYSMFGMTVDDDMINELKDQTARYAVQCRVVEAEFERRGLTLDKTEEEYNAEADKNYNDQLESCIQQITSGTDEEKKANAELILYSQGLTIESNRKQTILNAKIDKVVSAVEDEAAKPTEDDISAYYTEKLAEDEKTYTETPNGVETAMTDGKAVCWMPEGYRTVKHVLVIPESVVLKAVTDARSALTTAQNQLSTLETELANATAAPAETETAAPEATEAAATEAPRTAEEIQADIDAKKAELPDLEKAVADAEAACLASVKEKTDSVYAALESGTDFDSVMAEYGEDPGMKSEPNKTTGYYVRSDSRIWDSKFTEGAMALENVGDYSKEPIISSSGVHIIYYASDVTSGAVPFESVHDALYAEKEESLRTEHMADELAKWVEAVNPVYHLDKWTFQ